MIHEVLGWSRIWLPTTATVAIAAAVLLGSGVLGFVQRPAADALLRLVASSPLEAPEGVPDVAIVTIDARSMRALGGDWPWPRSRFAEIIERLDAAGARAIAFDIDFSTPRDAEGDRALARAMARSGRVVLSAHREFQQLEGLGELEIASLPLPELARSAAAVGAAIVEIDVDGVIRRAFHSREIAGERMPSLPAAALAVAQGQPAQAGTLAAIPIDYRRALPAPPRVAAIDVLEDRFDRRRVAGRVVLVGATAVEFQDLWTTPLGPNQPGVEIQAYALRTLAAQQAGATSLRIPGLAAGVAIAALLSLLAGSLPPARRTVVLLAVAGAIPFGCLGALRLGGVLLDPVLPLGVVGGHYLLGLEVVRRTLGQRLQERELSLSTLATVGEATTAPSPGQGVDLALALLGDVVSASGVGLLRSDGARLEWRREGSRPVGDVAAANAVLKSRQTRIFEGGIPGKRGGDSLAVYTPLYAGENPVGVLVVERESSEPLVDTQLRTIATVGTQLALSVENMRLYDGLQATFRSSITALASAVEARDGYTDQHCRRLGVFSTMMAERLGLAPEEIEAIELGALLHDVGKIGIRDDILLKSARLSEEERLEIERHPEIGHRIIGPINGLSPTTVAIVRHHHERWNGCGYPDGLAGDEIPLGARIVAIVDVWDALSTDRPYKRAYSQEAVREILTKDSGERFEPALLELFLDILDDRGDELLALIASTSEAAR